MLKTLYIKNIVLIDQLTLSWEDGLTALTGETGAGKSILLDSLGLVLGARAEYSLLRHGHDQAQIVAEFEIPPARNRSVLENLLQENGLSGEGDLILRRSLSRDGKSKASINDQPVSVGLLKEIGDQLVDIHGQFETYALLNSAHHRQVLDDYAHHHSLCSDVKQLYHAWKTSKEALNQEIERQAQAKAQEDYLTHAAQELDTLSPKIGEEAELLELKTRLSHQAILLQALGESLECLNGEQGSQVQIYHVIKNLQRVKDKMGSVSDPLIDQLDQVSVSLQDIERQLENLRRETASTDLNAEDIDDRLYALRACARKHRISCDELVDYQQRIAEDLKSIHQGDQNLKSLQKQLEEAKKHYLSQAKILHQKRIQAALQLDKKINQELPPLKLEKAKFRTIVDGSEDESQFSEHGFSSVVFQVSTNQGEFGPLQKIASGGEMARFMLALKVILAEQKKEKSVFVFDEIDTGIGGATASAVGDRLAKLARHHQVLVVTHSPQVAARANHHFVVSKQSGITSVTLLTEAQRQEEIARMLSGSSVTDEARAAATKLLEAAA
jgi:DNA repair protein RecN (Recombination protein N)